MSIFYGNLFKETWRALMLIREWLLMYFVEQLHLAQAVRFFLEGFGGTGKNIFNQFGVSENSI